MTAKAIRSQTCNVARWYGDGVARQAVQPQLCGYAARGGAHTAVARNVGLLRICIFG